MNGSDKKIRKLVVALGISLMVALSLAISANKSIWRDEAFSYLVARQPLPSIISIAAKDFTPPLYYLLLHPLVQLFGANALALRLLSLLPLLILQCLLVKEISRHPTSSSRLLETFLVLLIYTQPLLLYFSVELRAYSLAMLLTYVIFVTSSRRLTTRTSLSVYVLAQTALLYTHNIGMFFWIAQALTSSLLGLMHRDWPAVRRLLVANSLVLVLYLPWVPVLAAQMTARSGASWFTFHPLTSLNTLSHIFVFNELSPVLPRFYSYFSHLSWLVVGMGVVGNRWFKKQKPQSKDKNSEKVSRLAMLRARHALLIAGMSFSALYLYSWFAQPILYGRYVAFLFPLAFLSMALGWRALASWSKTTAIIAMALYATMQIAIASHFLNGLEKTQYQVLANDQTIPIYTDSYLDIMPCLYYRKDCVFVGDRTKAPNYVGVNQLPRLNAIDSWEEIVTPELILLRRNTHTIPQTLKSRFTHVYTHDLGDNVRVIRLAH